MGEGKMKKALEPLIAVCVLASVAQAQFCSTELTSDGVKATLLFTSREAADAVAHRAANDALTGNYSSVSLAGSLGHAWVRSGFSETSPDAPFRLASIAGPGQSKPSGSTDNGVAVDSTSTLLFTPPNLTETNGTTGWFGESRTDMRLQGMLDALEPDVQIMLEPEDSDADAAQAGDIRSAPEPTTYGLVGVMLLLGIAVARRLSGP